MPLPPIRGQAWPAAFRTDARLPPRRTRVSSSAWVPRAYPPPPTSSRRQILGRSLWLASFSLTNELVVFGMRADPKPGDPVLHVNAESTIMKPNAHGRILADSLELKRRVTRVGAKQRERFVRQGLDFNR